MLTKKLWKNLALGLSPILCKYRNYGSSSFEGLTPQKTIFKDSQKLIKN